MAGFNTKVTPEIERLTQECKDHSSIDLSLYGKYDVKRGLRDINGKGVLAVSDLKRRHIFSFMVSCQTEKNWKIFRNYLQINVHYRQIS